MHARRITTTVLALLALFAMTACANDTGSAGSEGGSPAASPPASAVQQTGGSGSTGGKGSVVISGQDFTEMQIMAQMYKQLLENDGYSVELKLVKTRDVYMPQLTSGDVDVVPEYLSGITDYLNKQQNGANAKTVSSHSPQETMQALKPMAKKANVTMLKPAKATDQNAFAVTKKFAKKHHLTTLSDLAKLNKPIVLAAAPDCKGRPDCSGGLTKVYGLNISKILPLGFDSPQTKDSVKSGESQLGLVATTDGSLDEEGLVILSDDKGIQPAQNLVPAVNTDFLQHHQDIAATLNKLSATLTTKDLGEMNTKVGVERAKAADVAHDYLTSKDLL